MNISKRAVLVIVALLGMAMSVSAQSKTEYMNSIRESYVDIINSLPRDLGSDAFGGRVMWVHLSVSDAEGVDKNPAIIFGYQFTGLSDEELPGDLISWRRELRKTMKEQYEPVAEELKRLNMELRIGIKNKFGRQVALFVFPSSDLFPSE